MFTPQTNEKLYLFLGCSTIFKSYSRFLLLVLWVLLTNVPIILGQTIQPLDTNTLSALETVTAMPPNTAIAQKINLKNDIQQFLNTIDNLILKKTPSTFLNLLPIKQPPFIMKNIVVFKVSTVCIHKNYPWPK